jgi:hypothetical protein
VAGRDVVFFFPPAPSGASRPGVADFRIFAASTGDRVDPALVEARQLRIALAQLIGRYGYLLATKTTRPLAGDRSGVSGCGVSMGSRVVRDAPTL